ncbi:MAG: class I SAM-dependent methyltransferase [Flavobacteriaceae bacterium]|nr:class I SAM-dependent methyltransferase [Flavobacteriaceae bacterium]
MFFQAMSMLNFIFTATNAHGVHSPFVYQLVTDCFYDRQKKPWYKAYHQYRDQLLNDSSRITVTDFGAGSRSMKTRERSVSHIARGAGITAKRAHLLGRLVTYLNTGRILEIGTSVGLATAACSMAKPESTILSVEGCKNTAAVAQKYLDAYKPDNIEIVTGNFDDILPELLKEAAFDLIFFDGNHREEATIRYFEQCLKYAHNDSVFIFDDIYWSKGMQQAWQYICRHPKVRVSIDTYRWGLVFFRKEQEKEHFKIRL